MAKKNQPTEADHHSNLASFLQILAALAPVIASPFIKSDRANAIVAAETPAVLAIVNALANK